MSAVNHQYRTSDTGLATYLITQGFPLISIDYAQPRYEFNFISSPEIKDHSDKYLTGRAITDPASFLRVNKKLLRLLHNQGQWGDE